MFPAAVRYELAAFKLYREPFLFTSPACNDVVSSSLGIRSAVRVKHDMTHAAKQARSHISALNDISNKLKNVANVKRNVQKKQHRPVSSACQVVATAPTPAVELFERKIFLIASLTFKQFLTWILKS